ncbi:hypothetical protein A2U01_0106086, partial [Trifolium medium]|nr:hypothetical protein [Trifolium medium]
MTVGVWAKEKFEIDHARRG